MSKAAHNGGPSGRASVPSIELKAHPVIGVSRDDSCAGAHAHVDNVETSSLASLPSVGSVESQQGAGGTTCTASGVGNRPQRGTRPSGRLSNLASKMSDFLLSTRQSLDLDHEYALESPMNSRNSSSLSLNLLSKPTIVKRPSFFGRSPPRPSSHSHANGAIVTTNGSNPAAETDQVKETHHVRVEYDPVTRKRVLNTYEIVKDLGAGQHGKVKLARDLRSGKNVAIKIVDRTNKGNAIERLTKRGHSQEDKIRREIAIMKKCNHPHVVRLLEVLDAENSRKIYLVLEYLEKGEIKWQQLPEDLSGVQEPLLSLRDTKHAFRDVVCGLEYLHHQNIIHRDIKPSNLLMDKHGNVKISDFGVSFAASLNGEDEFELAKTAGTPAFLAPELCQITSTAKVTHKIDIWALGITLYCLLFGRLPFTAESEFKLFDVINKSPLAFPDMTKWIDAEPLEASDLAQAKDILEKLLEKDPEHRIDVDAIKLHPFYLQDLTPQEKSHYEDACWKVGMEINVSNKEMDEAVVGIGGLIRKKFTDMRKAWSSSSNTPSSQSTDKSADKLRPSGLSAISLRDSHSYIFSEVQSDILSNETFSPTKSELTQIPDISPSHLTENGLDENLSEDSGLGQECAQRVDSPDDDRTIPENTQPAEEDEYDFRKELEKSDLRASLTVNPSYASLDSYYDEGYNRFFSNTTSAIGSFSNRNQIYSNSPRNVSSSAQRISPSKQSSLSGSNSSFKRGFQPPQRERYSPEVTSPQMRPISPLVNQMGILPNRTAGYTQWRYSPKQAQSSSEDDNDDDDDEPFMINKKSLASRRYSARQKEIPLPAKEEESDHDSITIDTTRSPVKLENVPRTAIYGTRLNLFRSHSNDGLPQSDSEYDSDDELMLNFNRPASKSQNGTVPEVVDVPKNIIQGDHIVNSAGQNKDSYMYNSMLKDIAVVSINNEDTVDQ